MKKKYILLILLIVISMFSFFNLNVYGAYDLPTSYENHSYPSEYEKYIGLYYTVDYTGGNTYEAFSPEKTSLYNDIFKLNVTAKKTELDKWCNFNGYESPSGGIVCCREWNSNLEDIFEKSSTYKSKTTDEINEKGATCLILEKGTLTITDDSGKILAKVPHYILCKRVDTYIGAGQNITIKQYEPKVYRSRGSSETIKNDLNTIYTTYNNFQTNTNIGNTAGSNNNSSTDFWGDASSWFGQAQNSGYQIPEQVNNIIGIFSDMINVVGTTVIVIATIVLGIKYIIGSVESKTSAKEGLITLFIACVFFFGWTAIKGLLFPGNAFIFTSTSDTSYTNMVGRIFSTFTYIAQFVVVASIIYVGIKYIFAGADGRAELKAKSVYFIIGIILVFATTNVLSFISKIINEAI